MYPWWLAAFVLLVELFYVIACFFFNTVGGIARRDIGSTSGVSKCACVSMSLVVLQVLTNIVCSLKLLPWKKH